MSSHISRRSVLAAALTTGAVVGPLAGVGTAAAKGSAAAQAPSAGMPKPVSPFLEGAFTPVNAEVTAFNLPVTGSVPADLNGRYLRNGPNALGLDDPIAHHWASGDGMVHGVRLREGRAE